MLNALTRASRPAAILALILVSAAGLPAAGGDLSFDGLVFLRGTGVSSQPSTVQPSAAAKASRDSM